MSIDNLVTPAKLAKIHPDVFPEPTAKYLVRARHSTGFDVCCVRIGRSILIDLDKLPLFIDAKREAAA